MQRYVSLQPILGASESAFGHRLESSEENTTVILYAEDDSTVISKLEFDGVLAIRFVLEEFSEAVPPESANAIGEVLDSLWLSEVHEAHGHVHPAFKPRKHFYSYIIDVGVLEVLATSFKLFV